MAAVGQRGDEVDTEKSLAIVAAEVYKSMLKEFPALVRFLP